MVHNLIEDRREYPLGNVRRAEVELLMRSGSLALAGGAAEFCSALFEYSHPELRPLDRYAADDDEARLEISCPETHNLRNTRNAWQLAFNSNVTMEMAIQSQSGKVDLDLDRVLLSNLEVKSRSGAVQARLGGSYPDLDEVQVHVSSGRVSASLTGKFPTLASVEVDTRSGKTELALTGDCPELRRVAIDAMSGAVEIDMRGAFQRNDLGVRVESKSGSVRIRLPEGVGSSLNASTMSGRVRAEGFSTGSGRWTNAAFERTPATIWLNVRVMSGSIDITSG